MAKDDQRHLSEETLATPKANLQQPQTASISDSKQNLQDKEKEGKENVETADEVIDLDDQEAFSRGLVSLEKFRDQQKRIEEANKQKKALLAKTITERQKAAKKETHKLEHIQRELSKLDHLLTADVQVIRGRIEDASRVFMDAQKRFEKAEAEYVTAKMELHNTLELKEQLTEHLYTIIHQNEVRKARKLAELMKNLEMEAEEQEVSLPELPPFTSFQPTDILLSPSTSKQHLTLKERPRISSQSGDGGSGNPPEHLLSNKEGDASNEASASSGKCETRNNQGAEVNTGIKSEAEDISLVNQSEIGDKQSSSLKNKLTENANTELNSGTSGSESTCKSTKSMESHTVTAGSMNTAVSNVKSTGKVIAEPPESGKTENKLPVDDVKTIGDNASSQNDSGICLQSHNSTLQVDSTPTAVHTKTAWDFTGDLR
ncbi:RAB6-interacting golgin-like isoform X2 [Mya arenaria]|nr:RAB6-interacting golgin-like isoform X2 [Mya arenaria]